MFKSKYEKLIIASALALVLPSCSNTNGSDGKLPKGADCSNGASCASGLNCYIDGHCRPVCETPEGCDPDEKCTDSVCLPVENPQCHNDAGCEGNNVPQCSIALNVKCVAGTCVYQSKEKGASCDDNNPCTVNDACDGNGSCVGTKNPCTTPPSAACSPDNSVYITYSATGKCDPYSEAGCTYEETSTPCPNCAENCLKLCENMECPSSPDGCSVSSCVANTTGPSCEKQNLENGTKCQTSSGTEGQCNNGVCQGCLENSDCFANPDAEWPECYGATCREGKCEYAPFSGSCAGVCKNGIDYSAGSCQNNGNCATVPTNCAPYACNPSGVGCLSTCSSAEDCQEGYHCFGQKCYKPQCASDSDCGLGQHCQAASRLCTSGGPGDGCEDNGDCDVGHHCQSSTKKCVPGYSNGAACDNNDDCDDNFRCAFGKCQVGDNNQPCETIADCKDSSYQCILNVLTNKKVCANGTSGAYCDNDSQCQRESIDSKDDMHCQLSIHTCVTGQPGQSTCDDHDDCDDDHRCFNGKCQYGQAGSPCTLDEHCSSVLGFKCVNEKCGGKDGDSCSSNDQCFHNYCSMTKNTKQYICSTPHSDGSTQPKGGESGHQGHSCLSSIDCGGISYCDLGSHICRFIEDKSCSRDSDCDQNRNYCRLSTGKCVTGKPGDQCDDDDDCDSGHHCLQSLSICVTGAVGDRCDDDNDCDDSTNSSGHHCRQSTHTCVRGEPTNPTTECTSNSDCPANGSNYFYECNQKIKRCVKEFYNGESACDDDNDCDNDHRCNQSIRRCLSGAYTEFCEVDHDCQQYWHAESCVNNRCTENKDIKQCTKDSDCAGGSHCIDQLRKCSAGMAGDFCANDNDCNSGNCDPINGLCRAGTSGDSCLSDNQCASGYHCATTSGVCTAGKTGEPCDSKSHCQRGLNCVSRRLTKPQCFGGQQDEPCDIDDDCKNGLKCITTESRLMGTCGGANGSLCNSASQCAGGQCGGQKCDDTNSNCTNNVCCQSSSDPNATCCTDNSQCSFGYICDTTSYNCTKAI